jgi:allantoinase
LSSSVAVLEARRHAAAGRCFVDVGFWGAAVPANAVELAALWEAGVFGFACAIGSADATGLPPMAEADLRAVMPGLRRIGAPILSPDQPLLLIQLCRELQPRTHLLSLAASDPLAPLYHARTAGAPVSAGTCPHYLYFVADDHEPRVREVRCAPPVGGRADREFLWASLANGLIQTIASAHAPAPARRGWSRILPFAQGPKGIASVQLELPVLFTAAAGRAYSIEQVVDWMCRRPAALAGLSRKGHIEAGCDADLVVFNANTDAIVDAGARWPDHAFTPYAGSRLRGAVQRTYLRGQLIFNGSRMIGEPRGQLLSR